MDHAVQRGVTNSAVTHDHVAAQYSFLLGTEPDNRVSRLRVQNVRDELHAVATPLLEGMPQHEVLRLRVDVGTLPPLCKERKAYLHATMIAVDRHEPRAPDN